NSSVGGGVTSVNDNNNNNVEYACEVVTFGRPDHYALGVVSGMSTAVSTTSSENSQYSHAASSTTTFSTQRVQEFAQESVGREGAAIAVAAATHHTLVVTKNGHLGEVYVWGDNTNGQLGVSRRSGIQKLQRVEALWKASSSQGNKPKIAIAIAAADQSTLVITSASSGGLSNVNSIYEWGHGNHVPIRVHFEHSRSKSGSIESESATRRFGSGSDRVINPVAIACGKYHNAAITSDGLVYTWGLHAESLGRNNNSSGKQQQRRNSLPQIVSDLLPENGGGLAVAIAASDQRTAVVCDN
ncbi:MAG: hypothetical protein SGILL_009129, partial [Bacillariaceae sp.]